MNKCNWGLLFKYNSQILIKWPSQFVFFSSLSPVWVSHYDTWTIFIYVTLTHSYLKEWGNNKTHIEIMFNTVGILTRSKILNQHSFIFFYKKNPLQALSFHWQLVYQAWHLDLFRCILNKEENYQNYLMF